MPTNVFGDPTITIETFSRVLAEAGSPVLAEQPAGVYWTTIRQYGIDPAAMLAIFHHESNFGTDPNSVCARYDTRNWGNVRSKALPWPGCPVIATDRGPFVKFDRWAQGLADACARLIDPRYPYHKAGATTVETIIPIWAPASDSNTPDAYIRAVLADMAAWAKERDMASPYADRASIIPRGFNRTGQKLLGMHAVVIHETANYNAGANAQMHHTWITGAPREKKPSPHFFVDKGESLQVVPADELGWHIGDGADEPTDEAFFTIGIELCVNDRAGFPAVCRRGAKVAARLLTAKGLRPVPDATVRQHGSYWSSANPDVHIGCPERLRAGDWGVGWSDFLGMVAEEYRALNPVADPGFPGALQPDGRTVLNAVDFGGAAESVVAVEIVVRNKAGAHYARRWSGYLLDPWRLV